MCSLKPRSIFTEWFIKLLKYITPPANVNAHSLNMTMDMYIPRRVKEGTCRQRSTNRGPNAPVLGLHQKVPQVYMAGNVF